MSTASQCDCWAGKPEKSAATHSGPIPAVPADEAEEWEVTFRKDLPRDMYGFTSWKDRRITLADKMSLAEVRSTLIHEELHVLRGPVGVAEEEVVVELMTAAQMIRPHFLAGLPEWVARDGEDAWSRILGCGNLTVHAGVALATAVRAFEDWANS